MILTAWELKSEIARVEFADRTILTAWEMRFAETDESIFLSAASTALWEKQCRVADADFAADRATLTVEKLSVERISAEITAENLKDSWFVSEFFISVKLDFLRNISSLFLLMSILQDIMIELISWSYNW